MAEAINYNSKYKDTLFRWIFGKDDEKGKQRRLELYNALNNSNYTDPDALEVTTLEDVICMSMKNDLSFLVDSKMNLYEEQSTLNPNMPLRGLMYFSRLYQVWLTKQDKDLYGRTVVKIPTSKYIVFYIGQPEIDDIVKLKLSDAFIVPDASGEFEWTATMININEGHNNSLGKKCKPLYDYISYIARIRKNMQAGMEKHQAISSAVEWAIQNNLLGGFFAEQKAEVEDVSITEFDEELFIRNRRREGYAEGIIAGEQQKAVEDTKNLLRMKLGTIEQIAQVTGLPIEQVQALAAEMQE